jgi:DNA polymerase-3 subunit delta'
MDYNDVMSWNMIGHEWAVNMLRKHIASAKVRHAYLFTGPDAVGKRTLALRFAQALNCENVDERGDHCWECRACRLTHDRVYPDLHIVEAEQIGGVLKVDQIRQLLRQLSLAPYEGRWRVGLFLRFHEANDSAANALLKTLEEPAPKVVLLLTARSAEALLPTIVSRCEVIPLRTLSSIELARALQERGENAEQAELLAGLSSGRPGRALQVAQEPKILEKRQEIIDKFLTLLKMNRAERFAYAAEMTRAREPAKRRENAAEVLEVWLSLWRDTMIFAYKAEAAAQNPDRKQDLERLTAKLGSEKVTASLRSIERTLNAIQQYANVRLALEALMIELPQVK